MPPEYRCVLNDRASQIWYLYSKILTAAKKTLPHFPASCLGMPWHAWHVCGKPNPLRTAMVWSGFGDWCRKPGIVAMDFQLPCSGTSTQISQLSWQCFQTAEPQNAESLHDSWNARQHLIGYGWRGEPPCSSLSPETLGLSSRSVPGQSKYPKEQNFSQTIYGRSFWALWRSMFVLKCGKVCATLSCQPWEFAFRVSGFQSQRDRGILGWGQSTTHNPYQAVAVGARKHVADRLDAPSKLCSSGLFWCKGADALQELQHFDDLVLHPKAFLWAPGLGPYFGPQNISTLYKRGAHRPDPTRIKGAFLCVCVLMLNALAQLRLPWMPEQLFFGESDTVLGSNHAWPHMSQDLRNSGSIVCTTYIYIYICRGWCRISINSSFRGPDSRDLWSRALASECSPRTQGAPVSNEYASNDIEIPNMIYGILLNEGVLGSRWSVPCQWRST